MRHRVGDADRAHSFGDEPCETLGDSHPHAADAFLSQADGCGQNERDAIRIQEVHRAHVGAEPALNQVDDVRQRFGRVAAAETSRLISSSVQSRELSVYAVMRQIRRWSPAAPRVQETALR
jgi:hypothetical protein